MLSTSTRQGSSPNDAAPVSLANLKGWGVEWAMRTLIECGLFGAAEHQRFPANPTTGHPVAASSLHARRPNRSVHLDRFPGYTVRTVRLRRSESACMVLRVRWHRVRIRVDSAESANTGVRRGGSRSLLEHRRQGNPVQRIRILLRADADSGQYGWLQVAGDDGFVAGGAGLRDSRPENDPRYADPAFIGCPFAGAAANYWSRESTLHCRW